MLSAILPLRGYGSLSPWRFHPKVFLVGAAIFLSTFLTWKRTNGDNKNDKDDSEPFQ